MNAQLRSNTLLRTNMSSIKAPSTSYAMSPETLRGQGCETFDAIKKSLEKMATLPVRPKIEPGDLAKEFSKIPPTEGNGDNLHAILQEFEDKIIPGITNWQHPGFMAYYPASTSVPAVLGEMLKKNLHKIFG